MMFLLIWFYGCVTIEKIHPLEGGYLRRKVRRDRRPGMPIESPFLFYPKYLSELIAKHVKIASIVWRMSRTRRAIKRDPKARLYRDLALTPVADADLETLEMFQQNQSSRAAAAKAKLRAAAAA
ncbi:MAG: radical SAM protein, partial [Hyphomicrobiales bacterium]|nr:radical SAM protein [Hyphomicrobiales bacterium]